MVTEAPTVRGHRRQFTRPGCCKLKCTSVDDAQLKPWVWWRGRTCNSLSSLDQPQGSKRQPAFDQNYIFFLFQRQIDLKYGQVYLILKVAVGEDNTLRKSSRPTCVQDHRCILGETFVQTTFKTDSHLFCNLNWLESFFHPWFSNLLNLNAKALNLQAKHLT